MVVLACCTKAYLNSFSVELHSHSWSKQNLVLFVCIIRCIACYGFHLFKPEFSDNMAIRIGYI